MFENIVNEITEEMEKLVSCKPSNYIKGVLDMYNYVVELMEEMAYELPEE